MIIVPGAGVGLHGDGGNNEVATFTDDRTIQGEAELTFDGTTLDVDGSLVVDGSNISLDSTSTLNIDNSNTSNGIGIGTNSSGTPISIGHTTSEVTVNDNFTVTGTTDINNVVAIGDGGGTPASNIGLTVDHNSTSAYPRLLNVGNGASAVVVSGGGNVELLQVYPASTVVNASVTAAHVYTASFYEPRIDVSATSAAVTTAATVYIEGAASEATNNYALWVDSGASRFDGDITATGDVKGATVGISGGGTYAAGTLFSDSNWGMIFRAYQTNPAAADFLWQDSAGTEIFRADQSGGITSIVNVTLGSDGSGVNQQWYSDQAGRSMLWDAADERLEFNDNTYLSFGTDADTRMYHTGSAFYTATDTNYFVSGTSFRPIVQIINTNDDNGSGYLDFVKQSANPHVDDYLGLLRFIGDNAADEATVATTIYCNLDDLTDGQEDGSWTFQAMVYGTVRTWLHTTNTGTSNAASNIDCSMSGDLSVVALTETSDATLKENIQEIDTAIDTVKQLRPVTFDWKETKNSSIGFVAQDVEGLIPNVVKSYADGNSDKKYKSIKSSGILAHVTKALQESIEKIETLEAQVKELQEA